MHGSIAVAQCFPGFHSASFPGLRGPNEDIPSTCVFGWNTSVGYHKCHTSTQEQKHRELKSSTLASTSNPITRLVRKEVACQQPLAEDTFPVDLREPCSVL